MLIKCWSFDAAAWIQMSYGLKSFRSESMPEGAFDVNMCFNILKMKWLGIQRCKCRSQITQKWWTLFALARPDQHHVHTYMENYDFGSIGLTFWYRFALDHIVKQRFRLYMLMVWMYLLSHTIFEFEIKICTFTGVARILSVYRSCVSMP